MTFIAELNKELSKKHLLLHPLYQAWNKGELDNEILQTYAKEYYKHVAAFPMYISTIHSKCNDIEDRQILLGNLREEEEGEENHPELWKRFGEGLGCSREEFLPFDKLNNPAMLEKTNELVEGFFELVRSGYVVGLGALYAYERQIPEVAKTKIAGLTKFYGLSDERSLKFFEVHIKADEWHSEECAALIEKLPEDQKEMAKEGAKKGADLLWQFLDGIFECWNSDKKYVC